MANNAALLTTIGGGYRTALTARGSVTSIIPATAAAHGANTTLRVLGSAFPVGSVIHFDADRQVTTRISGAELNCPLPLSILRKGTVTVWVQAPNGPASHSMILHLT